MGTKVYATVPFNYNGSELDRGEIFLTKDCPNDPLLLGLRYMVRFDKTEHTTNKCDNCSRAFVNQIYLYAHKSKSGCMKKEQEITNQETGKITGIDPEKIKDPPMGKPIRDTSYKVGS